MTKLEYFIDVIQNMGIFYTTHKVKNHNLTIIALDSMTGVGPSDQKAVFYFSDDGNYLDNGTQSIWTLKGG